MLRAKRLFAAGLMAMVLSAWPVRSAEASECFDQFLRDTADCLAQRKHCIETTSFWVRTCNIEYLLCETAAGLAYADCNLEALGKVIAGIAQ